MIRPLRLAPVLSFTLCQTCKDNGLEPDTRLRRVLRELPSAKSADAVEALLPWKLRATDLVGETAH